MNWYRSAHIEKTADNKPQMSYQEALAVFGLDHQPSAGEVQKTYRGLASRMHPDRGGEIADFTRLQNAYEVLKNPQPSGRGYNPRSGNDAGSSGGIPEWQTDERSSYNGVGKDMRDVNYCKKAIWEFSKTRGEVEPWYIMAFDGSFFRHSFTAKTNAASLGYAGEVMAQWNSMGGNPYPSGAVIASRGSTDMWRVINIQYKDVSGQNLMILFDEDDLDEDFPEAWPKSSNRSPINSRKFTTKLQDMISRYSNKVDTYASIIDKGRIERILKKAQKRNLGYKIVGWDGKRAYSIYDKRITYSLAIGSEVGDVFLGTSAQFCIDYYSGGTNDEDMLLTFSYDGRDIISGGGENSEVRVRRARLEGVQRL